MRYKRTFMVVKMQRDADLKHSLRWRVTAGSEPTMTLEDPCLQSKKTKTYDAFCRPRDSKGSCCIISRHPLNVVSCNSVPALLCSSGRPY